MADPRWILAGGIGLLIFVACGLLREGLRRSRLQRRTRARWLVESEGPTQSARGNANLAGAARIDVAAPSDNSSFRAGPLRRRGRWIPWVIALAAAALLWLFAGWNTTFVGSTALIVGLLGGQLESLWAQRRAAQLEVQLADAVDLMVGALGAGTGALQAMEAALVETADPLRRELADTLTRIRYGDDPQSVFRQLSARVPLETFLLFASALAVHWEVGGSLAPVLATLGRTLRDRIELARRIRSNVAQSQLSTVAVLGLTYFIATVVWRNTPGQMERFVLSPVGGAAVAITMVLQAVGVVWMNAMSRSRY